MTTITREHLKPAAKAAGYASIDFLSFDTDGKANVYDSDGRQYAWQPHCNLSQAWELAERLEFTIDFQTKQIFLYTDGDMNPFVPCWPEDAATPAECVVLLAAEVGRGME